MRRGWAILPLAIAAGCAAGSVVDGPFGPDGKTIRQEVQTYPEEQRAAFALAERRCTSCHTLNEPFSAHVEPGGWRAIVRKMARQPGALIPSDDQEKIAAFFEYFFQRRAAKDK